MKSLSATNVRQLRESFDAAFAAPRPPLALAGVPLLIVRAGGEPLAVCRDEATGFQRAAEITPVPGRSAAFVGLAAVRGEICPVWNLGGLLGRESRGGAGEGWLILAGSVGFSCAFFVEEFERMIVASPDALPPVPDSAGDSLLRVGAVSCDSGLVPLLRLPAALSRISTLTTTHPMHSHLSRP